MVEIGGSHRRRWWVLSDAWPSWNHGDEPGRTPSGKRVPARPTTTRGPLAPLIESLLGRDLPVGFESYDGTRLGPRDPQATIVVRSPDALRRIATAPGELGLARAYVAGDVDFEGDIFAALEVRRRIDGASIGWREVLDILRIGGPSVLRPLPAPPEETKPRGRLHSIAARRLRHLPPLRRGQRVLRAAPRADHDLFVRGVEQEGRGARRPHDPAALDAAQVGQVRADLPQARASSRACACSTWDAAGAAWSATRPATTACEAVGITVSAEQARLGPPAASKPRA